MAYFSTTSFSMTGQHSQPPANVKVPALKKYNEQNAKVYGRLVFIGLMFRFRHFPKHLSLCFFQREQQRKPQRIARDGLSGSDPHDRLPV